MTYITLKFIKERLCGIKQEKPILTSLETWRDLKTNWQFINTFFGQGILNQAELYFLNDDYNKNQNISKLMNAHGYDGSVKSGLVNFLKNVLIEISNNNELFLDFAKTVEAVMQKYVFQSDLLHMFVLEILENEAYEIPSSLRIYLKSICREDIHTCFAWILLLAFLGPYNIRGLSEIWSGLTSILPSQHQMIQIKSETAVTSHIELSAFRAYAFGGKEETVETLEVFDNTLTVHLNFEPIRLRSEIPDWASIVVVIPPTNYNRFNYFKFDICFLLQDINKIQLEIKPFQKQWMHFSYVIQNQGTSWESVEIPLYLLEQRTLENIEEICFVMKSSYFNESKHLCGTYCLRNIRFE